jgi:hypothetical protein
LYKLALLFCLVSAAGRADMACDIAQSLLGRDRAIGLHRAMLDRVLSSPAAMMTALRKKPASIRTSTLEPLPGPGVNNGGIFVGELAGGSEAVVKLVGTRLYQAFGGKFNGTRLDHPSFATPVLIQDMLASLEMAPKLLGVLGAADTAKWMKRGRIQLKEDKEGDHVTLLMEPLDRPWNVNRSGATPPSEIAGWSEAKVRKLLVRVKLLELTLEKLGVYAYDAQVFVMPDGTAMLGDFDYYRRLKPGEKPWRLNPQIEAIAETWAEKSGRSLPHDEIQALVAYGE